jgi:hypothetical protein
VIAEFSAVETDEGHRSLSEAGRTYTMCGERLVSWLVGGECALGVCHGVCVSSRHLEECE